MSGPAHREGVAVVASRVRTDDKRIMAALRRRGVRHEYVDARTFWWPAGGAERPWGMVLNREIGHTRAVHLAHTLEASGARVVNSAAATELCGDKWRCTLALRAAGLPVPRTALALTPPAALDALDAIGYPAVIKPLIGSWGRLVSLVPDRPTAETIMEYVAALPSPQAHLVYVQELVAKPERDIRVLVAGGEVVGGSYRTGAGLRTNVALGGAAQPCELGPELAKLAVSAAQAVRAELAGVDLIEDGAGAVSVLEVNDRVEFTGLQAALGDRVDVADRIVDRLLAEV
jgi:[lysine-biosynthesis-protein LysW]---L-2-aminoadipate ligase